eukprot:gene13515-biopygen7386
MMVSRTVVAPVPHEKRVATNAGEGKDGVETVEVQVIDTSRPGRMEPGHAWRYYSRTHSGNMNSFRRARVQNQGTICALRARLLLALRRGARTWR